MSYHFDTGDNALVIDGFEKGIADSPHTGLADMRNVNIISVPAEASVNFSTSQVSPPAVGTGTVVSADSGADTVTYTGASGLEIRSSVVFSGASLPAGITAGTIYWVASVTGGTFKLYTENNLSNLVNITGTGTGTFTVFSMTGAIKYFTTDSNNATYGVDSAGLVWCGNLTGGNNWSYLGNIPNNGSAGQGIVAYTGSDGAIWLFVFSNGSIDYIKNPITGASPAWVYGWLWTTTGAGAAWSATPVRTLKATVGGVNTHEAFVAPTNQVIFCDTNWIGRFYEKNPATPFDPATPATYTFDQTALLPFTDTAQCLAYLGTNIMVGGKKNIIYPWNGTATTFNYPILLAENNIQKMVTVNTNIYALVGNRGRIYVTNGTNASLYKKIPDHISGTVEPYFAWGGLTSTKNQIYFSALATTNAGAAISQYGGLWAIDVDTNALRLTNKLSYGTYAGYATAIISTYTANPAGTGLFIGWDSGASTYGIDKTISTPYVNSEATIDSDLLPIGTFQKPRDFTKVEYRLTRPLVSGESVTIKTRLIFNTSDTGYTTTLTDSTVGNYSNIGDINFKNAQWVQFQIVLNSTASSPSYVRLKEIRVLGLEGPTVGNAMQLSI